LFSQARRITAFVDVDNQRALKQMQRMGFVYEGYCRLGINGVRDAYVYGMLRDDCRYLPGYTGGTTLIMENDHGQRAFTA
jgi:RimJ/RimL family protein N-acetyltransferase